MSVSSRTTDSMKISLGVLREVKVDNYVDGLNINTAGEKIRANEIPTYAIAEIVEDTVSILLDHFSVGVEAGVAKLGDFFGEKLDSIGRIAEDD